MRGPRTASSIEGVRPAPVALTLVVLLVAVFVFLSAGQGLGLGPLDLETADRLALALWIGAPIVGGLAARGADARGLVHGGIAVGLVVGLLIALFPSSGTGQYTCSLALPAVPLGYLIGRFAVGALVGSGMAIAFVVTGGSSRRLIAFVPGIVIATAVDLAASTAAYALFYDGVRCLS
jgi:hypothetical protein